MRYRPRFTLRTLALVLTLVCAYFGAWEATKKYGVKSQVETIEVGGENIQGVIDPLRTEYSPAPLIVCREYQGWGVWSRTYYLWIIGGRIELFER